MFLLKKNQKNLKFEIFLYPFALFIFSQEFPLATQLLKTDWLGQPLVSVA